MVAVERLRLFGLGARRLAEVSELRVGSRTVMSMEPRGPSHAAQGHSMPISAHPTRFQVRSAFGRAASLRSQVPMSTIRTRSCCHRRVRMFSGIVFKLAAKSVSRTQSCGPIKMINSAFPMNRGGETRKPHFSSCWRDASPNHQAPCQNAKDCGFRFRDLTTRTPRSRALVLPLTSRESTEVLNHGREAVIDVLQSSSVGVAARWS